MTRKQLRSDLLLMLQAGKPSGDFELGTRQADFVIDEGRKFFLREYIKKNIDMPASALTHLDCQTAQLETPVCAPASIRISKWFIDIPTVIQLREDKGVFRVARQGGQSIDRLRSEGENDIMKHLTYGKPSIDREAFYVLGKKVYLLGDNFANCKLQFSVVVSDTTELFAGSEIISETDPYPLPSDLQAGVIEYAFKVATGQLSTPEDTISDGKQ